jgi:hypothetical protein
MIAAAQNYTASLCRLQGVELVPYEQVDITAANDTEATLKATVWVKTMRDAIEEDTRLLVKAGARAVYSEALTAP